MKIKKHYIQWVEDNSIAQELGIEPGDYLLSINQKPVEDIFDYHFLINDEYIELLIEKPNQEQWLLEIEKEYEEDLGITFENGLMDEYKSCQNKCIFCFIDQMPSGMRDTLYFKDDDSRLSFLQGNYITLTNMKDNDINRIIEYHLEPINISFHTTNPELRCKMLNNRFAGEALKKVQRLYESGIVMNGQIVLCKGVNDGAELERSIEDLAEYLPYLQSVSVVPVGMTKFREGLFQLESFTKEDAQKVLETIHKWQKTLYKEHQTHFIHGGDEWYILAEQEIPSEETYDGYLQLENGVGMIRVLQDEFYEALEAMKDSNIAKEISKEISIATGKLAYPYIKTLIQSFNQKFPNVSVNIYEITNEFFGEQITVSGLITGQDLQKQLLGQKLGEKLLLPCNMLRNGEEVFLDDMTKTELESSLQVSIDIVKSSGKDLLESLLG